jgi:transposase-like protein
VKLVVADDHKGLRAAASKVLHATQQRCRVNGMRNLLARVPAGQRAMVAALLRTIFAQDTAEAAHEQWRKVADSLRERFTKVAELMDGAEHDVLAHRAFAREHWPQLASSNPLERLNGEIKRRTNVVGIFPNSGAVTRLVGAILLEQNDEWAVARRYMTLETMRPSTDTELVSLPAVVG